MRAAIINGFDIYKYKGGVELYTKGLVDLLRSQNIDVDIITFTQGYENDFFELGSSFEKYEKFYDLFIANNFYAFSYEPKIKGINIYHTLFRSMASKLKEVADVFWEDLYIGIMEELSFLDRNILCVSDNLKKDMLEMYEVEGFVIENYINDYFFNSITKEKAKALSKINSKKKVGLFVGRKDAAKGIDLFIELIKDTKDEVDWVLVSSSGGLMKDKEYETFIKENVKFYFETVDQEFMPYIYKSCDFYVNFSRYEGFGLSLIEALASGLKVISTPVGIASSVLKDEALITHPSDDFEKALKEAKEKIYDIDNLSSTHLSYEDLYKRFNKKRWDFEMIEYIKNTLTNWLTNVY